MHSCCGIMPAPCIVLLAVIHSVKAQSVHAYLYEYMCTIHVAILHDRMLSHIMFSGCQSGRSQREYILLRLGMRSRNRVRSCCECTHIEQLPIATMCGRGKAFSDVWRAGTGGPFSRRQQWGAAEGDEPSPAGQLHLVPSPRREGCRLC